LFAALAAAVGSKKPASAGFLLPAFMIFSHEKRELYPHFARKSSRPPHKLLKIW
jgi:hypothetical protein